MNIYFKFSLIVFAAAFAAGTYLAGHWLAQHPQDLTIYVWPFLKAKLFASNTATADWIVHGPGYGVAASDLLAAWQDQNPEAYRELSRVLFLPPLAGLMAGLAAWSFCISLDPGPGPVRHLRGRYLTSVREVAGAARRLYGAGLITFGSLRFPEWLEPEGELICGASGKGKTTAIMACLDVAARRADRAIIVDQNGVLMAHYMASNNILALNPFDIRGRDWSPLAEIHQIHDAPSLAKSMIPDAEGTEAKQWTLYAQQLNTAVLERLHVRGDATNAEFLRYFRPEGQADLKALVAGKTVSGIFMPGNERLAANVNGVLAMYLTSYEYLNPEAGPKSFSIKRWVQGGRGWLWLPYQDDQLEALRPLLASWLDIASTAATSLPPVKRPAPAWQFWKERAEPRRIWNVIDEVASLGRIQSLEHSITKGRKAGLRTVIGAQSVSQLRDRYGDNRTETILGSLNSALIFGTQDPDTAEYLSKRIGDAEVELTSTNQGRKAGELGASHTGHSTHRQVRRVVLPAEISALKNLNAYVALSGVNGVAKVEFKPRELLNRIPAFISKPHQPLPPPPPAAPTTSAPAAVGPEFV